MLSFWSTTTSSNKCVCDCILAWHLYFPFKWTAVIDTAWLLQMGLMSCWGETEKWFVLSSLHQPCAELREDSHCVLRAFFAGLIHVWAVIVRQVVIWSFDPNILHLPSLVWVWGAAGAQTALKQRLDFLQPPAFGLRETAVNEEEPQQSQTWVHKECTWKIRWRKGMIW